MTIRVIMGTVDVEDMLGRLYALANDLRNISNRDPEQEVQGMALPVLDAVVTSAREHLQENDPALESIADVISPENIEGGLPVRAIDALIVVNQLAAALEPHRRISI